MRIAALALVVLVAGGCDSGADDAGPSSTASAPRHGTVASLSPSTAGRPLYLSLSWQYDEGKGDQIDERWNMRVLSPATLPLDFTLPLADPGRYTLDFDVLRELPPCPSGGRTDPCWDKAKLSGRGKLAIGVLVAFEDADGDGRLTTRPLDPLVGQSRVFVLYAKDLDGQALKELGELAILNPQALRPGINLARVRCRDKVGWKGRFDPFEIVSPTEPLVIDSRQVLDAEAQRGDLCENWT
jgi:hypothetical protein